MLNYCNLSRHFSFENAHFSEALKTKRNLVCNYDYFLLQISNSHSGHIAAGTYKTKDSIKAKVTINRATVRTRDTEITRATIDQVTVALVQTDSVTKVGVRAKGTAGTRGGITTINRVGNNKAGGPGATTKDLRVNQGRAREGTSRISKIGTTATKVTTASRVPVDGTRVLKAALGVDVTEANINTFVVKKNTVG